MSKFRVIAFSILLFGGGFSIFSLIFSFGDWRRLAFVASAGIFLGVVAATSIEPKAFRHAWAYELVSGSLAWAVLGWVLFSRVEVTGPCEPYCAECSDTLRLTGSSLYISP